MITITHTVPIGDPADGEGPALDPEALWQSLRHKAESPVSYVPSITEASVVERYDDGFLREILLRGKNRYRERVHFEPKNRVVFEQLDDPFLALITNEIGHDADGRPTYTLAVTLSDGGIEKARQDPGFLAGTDMVFFDTARATANSLMLMNSQGNQGA
ncbi:AtaL-like protein [Streptomyces sp. NPDC047928]|uniref:AtaL-like protein n=1 Tax=unclassified Streptomyces TaxID=2593676 RepID=UPI00371D564D